MTTTEGVARDKAKLERLNVLNAFVKQCSGRLKEYRAKVQELSEERVRLALRIIGAAHGIEMEGLESEFAANEAKWSLNVAIADRIESHCQVTVSEIYKEFGFEGLDKKALG